jgi:RNA polymerase sigma factor (sigma-70 family)
LRNWRRRKAADPGAPVAQVLAPLSARIAAGDTRALGEFYEARFERMYALARTFTGRDESFCLDVVQETMLRVARRMKTMTTDADVDRWVGAVLRSAATDLLRREERRARRDRAAPATAPSVLRVAPVSSGEPGAALHAALATLHSDDLLLLKLRFDRGATLNQTGRALGTTGDAAHGRIRRALTKLRTILREPDA